MGATLPIGWDKALRKRVDEIKARYAGDVDIMAVRIGALEDALATSLNRRIVPSAGDAMFCEHANEVPAVCPCPPECYCRQLGPKVPCVAPRPRLAPKWEGEPGTTPTKLRLVIDKSLLVESDSTVDAYLKKAIEDFKASHPGWVFVEFESSSRAMDGGIIVKCKWLAPSAQVEGIRDAQR